MVTLFPANCHDDVRKDEELGLTQKSLAEKMGCSLQYVSKILKGKDIETLCKIEVALELSLLPHMEEEY